MRYEKPEMEIIDLEYIDTSAISNPDDPGLWEDNSGGNEQYLTVSEP